MKRAPTMLSIALGAGAAVLGAPASAQVADPCAPRLAALHLEGHWETHHGRLLPPTQTAEWRISVKQVFSGDEAHHRLADGLAALSRDGLLCTQPPVANVNRREPCGQACRTVLDLLGAYGVLSGPRPGSQAPQECVDLVRERLLDPSQATNLCTWAASGWPDAAVRAPPPDAAAPDAALPPNPNGPAGDAVSPCGEEIQALRKALRVGEHDPAAPAKLAEAVERLTYLVALGFLVIITAFAAVALRLRAAQRGANVTPPWVQEILAELSALRAEVARTGRAGAPSPPPTSSAPSAGPPDAPVRAEGGGAEARRLRDELRQARTAVEDELAPLLSDWPLWEDRSRHARELQQRLSRSAAGAALGTALGLDELAWAAAEVGDVRSELARIDEAGPASRLQEALARCKALSARGRAAVEVLRELPSKLSQRLDTAARQSMVWAASPSAQFPERVVLTEGERVRLGALWQSFGRTLDADGLLERNRSELGDDVVVHGHVTVRAHESVDRVVAVLMPRVRDQNGLLAKPIVMTSCV